MNPWGSADRLRWIYIAILVAAVIASASALVTVEPNKFWTVALQVLGVLAGAALGNALTHDHSRSLLDQQAGGSIRRLFEQASRLGGTVLSLESRRDDLRTGAVAAEAHRVVDWLDHTASSLRNEIEATASAIEDWGAVAPRVRDAEISKYKERKQRLPIWQQDGSA